MSALSSTSTRILLTGASGFIGSRVARRLVELGHDVTAVVRPDSDRFRLDGLDSSLRLLNSGIGPGADAEPLNQALTRGEFDLCIHAAWPSVRGDALANLKHAEFRAESTDLIVRLARAGCRRFVGIGTCLEYDAESQVPFSEDATERPRDLYATSKHAVHMMLGAIGAITGMETAWLRLFQVYGPAENPQRLVAAVTRALLRGQEAQTTPAEQVRDYLHVDDVADAICIAALSTIQGGINIASGSAVRIRELIERIGELVGRTDLLRIGALPYRTAEPPTLVGDPTRLRSATGWRPRFSLEAGLQNTIDWWRNHDPMLAARKDAKEIAEQ